MEENQFFTPHDDFFKLLMESREYVSEIIAAAVPEKIVQKLEFTSLSNVNSTFSNGNPGKYHADIVYECIHAGKHSVTISLLFEHKSYVEKYPHLQLLRYMLGVWEKQKRNGEKLRPIIPILFYHGKSKWHYRSFEKYFEGWDRELSCSASYWFEIEADRRSEQRGVLSGRNFFIELVNCRCRKSLHCYSSNSFLACFGNFIVNHFRISSWSLADALRTCAINLMALGLFKVKFEAPSLHTEQIARRLLASSSPPIDLSTIWPMWSLVFRWLS